MATELWAVGLVILGTLVGSFGPILLKKGSQKFNRNIFQQFTNYNMISGLALYGISTIIFIPALRGGELSVLYPLVAMAYVWVCLLSIKFLHEKMNALKWLGILLIIIGAAFIGIGS